MGEGPCRLFVSKGGENAASAFVGPALPDLMMAQIRWKECLDLHLAQGSKLSLSRTEIEHDHCIYKREFVKNAKVRAATGGCSTRLT